MDSLGKALGGGPSSNNQVAFWVAAGVGLPLVAGAIWYYVQDTYYYYTPVEYQYRPGMISGWVSKLLDQRAKRRRQKRPIRVYMDGCFDMMHYGHANALRQAKALGDELVVGLIPDVEILRNKGPPVMNGEERLAQVEAVKWVDEVMTGVPYDLTPEFLEELFTKHRIDYVVHGDDPCLLPDGTDAYAHAKQLGKFKVIKRTEGVSSTDIVGRMLMCTRANKLFAHDRQAPARRLTREFSSKSDREDSSNGEAVSRFMPTSRRIVQFSSGRSAPTGAKIVYIDGAWDLFHVGHIKTLQEARKYGDFLLVGVHCDDDVSGRRGAHLPIMNLHERSLSVLACKYVDEVIIGAPLHLTEDLLKTFNISMVVRGTVTETTDDNAAVDPARYAVAKEKGMFKVIHSPSTMISGTIIHRIVANRQSFEAKHKRKAESEANYYEGNKGFVAEL